MTCIIGMIGKNNDKVIIGADEMTSSNLGDVKLTYKDNKYIEKIWKVSNNNNFILGASGDVGLIETFKYHCNLPSEKELKEKNQEFDKKYIHYNIIDKFEIKGSNRNPKILIMIGYKNKIFILNPIEGFVDEIEGSKSFVSIGSGRRYAESALLYSTKYNKDIDEVLEIGRSLQVTSEKCTTVAPPIYITNNIYSIVYEYDDKSYQIYETIKQIEFV